MCQWTLIRHYTNSRCVNLSKRKWYIIIWPLDQCLHSCLWGIKSADAANSPYHVILLIFLNFLIRSYVFQNDYHKHFKMTRSLRFLYMLTITRISKWLKYYKVLSKTFIPVLACLLVWWSSLSTDAQLSQNCWAVLSHQFKMHWCFSSRIITEISIVFWNVCEYCIMQFQDYKPWRIFFLSTAMKSISFLAPVWESLQISSWKKIPAVASHIYSLL